MKPGEEIEQIHIDQKIALKTIKETYKKNNERKIIQEEIKVMK